MSLAIQYRCQNSHLKQDNFIEVIENNDTLLNPWTGGFNAVQISTINLNNDSLNDLFIFDRTGDKVLTFINDGVNFNYSPEYEKKFPNELRNWVILRDFNGDNKKDIFCSVSGGIGVWENSSVGNEISFLEKSFYHPSLNSQVPYILSQQYSSYTNIYVANSDIPDINDIDGDGDLDILTFGVVGSRLEYHQNLSVDSGYGN